jgi:hypothetical protein
MSDVAKLRIVSVLPRVMSAGARVNAVASITSAATVPVVMCHGMTRYPRFVSLATGQEGATDTEYAAITATWFLLEARNGRRLLKRR